jgi:hypothetical protein
MTLPYLIIGAGVIALIAGWIGYHIAVNLRRAGGTTSASAPKVHDSLTRLGESLCENR